MTLSFSCTFYALSVWWLISWYFHCFFPLPFCFCDYSILFLSITQSFMFYMLHLWLRSVYVDFAIGFLWYICWVFLHVPVIIFAISISHKSISHKSFPYNFVITSLCFSTLLSLSIDILDNSLLCLFCLYLGQRIPKLCIGTP